VPKNELYDNWWNEADRTEQSMEDEHQHHWMKVMSMIEEKDLRELSILDFGCNQGGFLRLLYKNRPFRRGMGVDLAKSAIEIANERKGDLPITYIATGNPRVYKEKFELATSISVIYLITDLERHARVMREVLKPGGVYYATFTDYSKNPALLEIKKCIDEHATIPMQLHSLNDIAEAFVKEGFSASIRRMQPLGYISIDICDKWFSKISDRMQFEYEEAYIFRFVKP